MNGAKQSLIVVSLFGLFARLCAHDADSEGGRRSRTITMRVAALQVRELLYLGTFLHPTTHSCGVRYIHTSFYLFPFATPHYADRVSRERKQWVMR